MALHIADVKYGIPNTGDMLSFDMEPSKKNDGSMSAKNAEGCTIGVAHEGIVKSFLSHKGYGFIDVGGTDVFVHVRECKGHELNKDDVVHFDMEPNPNKPEQMVAKNVTGGTGGPPGGGKGKGWEGNGKGSWGPMSFGGGMKGGWNGGFNGGGKGKGGGKSQGQCKWCTKGECWTHGQIPNPGKGGKAGPY